MLHTSAAPVLANSGKFQGFQERDYCGTYSGLLVAAQHHAAIAQARVHVVKQEPLISRVSRAHLTAVCSLRPVTCGGDRNDHCLLVLKDAAKDFKLRLRSSCWKGMPCMGSQHIVEALQSPQPLPNLQLSYTASKSWALLEGYSRMSLK